MIVCSVTTRFNLEAHVGKAVYYFCYSDYTHCCCAERVALFSIPVGHNGEL